MKKQITPTLIANPQCNEKSEGHRFTKMLYYFFGCFTLLAVFLIIFPAWFGTFHYFIDIFSHFREQVAIVGILSGTIQVILVVYKKKKILALLFPLLAITIIGLYLPKRLQIKPDKLTQGDIYYLNMNIHNSEEKIIINQIEQTNAQTVAIVELTTDMSQSLQQDYPYFITTNKPTDSDNCGIFSKIKPIQTNIYKLSYNICTAQFSNYTLIAVHPLPPLNSNSWELQKKHFKEINKLYSQLKNEGQNPIIVGDFNSTVYSPIYKSQFGKFNEKVRYTWNKSSILTLPIDHVLSELDLKILLLNQLSSDHTALLIKLPVK